MKFVHDLRVVSEGFFFALGLLILVALLFWRNDVFAYEAEVFLRCIDAPFLFTALLFGGSSIRLGSREDQSETQNINSENPILDAVLIIVGSILLLGFLFVDLGLPDKL